MIPAIQDRIRTPQGFEELVLEPISLSMDWARYFGLAHQPLKNIADRSCMAIELACSPLILANVARRAAQLYGAVQNGPAHKVASKTARLMNAALPVSESIIDGISLLKGRPIPETTGGPISCLYLIPGLYDVGRILVKMANNRMGDEKLDPEVREIESKKFTLNLIDLAYYVSNVAYAVLGIVTFIFGFVVVSIGPYLIITTVYFLSKVASYFYKNLS